MIVYFFIHLNKGDPVTLLPVNYKWSNGSTVTGPTLNYIGSFYFLSLGHTLECSFSECSFYTVRSKCHVKLCLSSLFNSSRWTLLQQSASNAIHVNDPSGSLIPVMPWVTTVISPIGMQLFEKTHESMAQLSVVNPQNQKSY